MFNFVRENFTITHLNLRTETHGDEKVKAIDVKFEADMPNAVLNKFSSGLKDGLYMADEGAVKDMLNPDFTPHLRHPVLATPFKLDNKMEYARLDIHDDNDLGHLVFTETKAGNVKVTCKEGGTTHVSFSIAITDPSKEDQADLYALLNETVKISVEAEEKEKQPAASSDGSGPLFNGGDQSGDPDFREVGDDTVDGGDGGTSDGNFNKEEPAPASGGMSVE